MSTDTPSPADETRPHATEPAEGADAPGDGTDVREHSTDPAEGEDPADS